MRFSSSAAVSPPSPTTTTRRVTHSERLATPSTPMATMVGPGILRKAPQVLPKVLPPTVARVVMAGEPATAAMVAMVPKEARMARAMAAPEAMAAIVGT